MSVLGLSWSEAAYVSTSEDAWSAFIKSRFEVLASRTLAVSHAIQSRMLDLELSMMKKYTSVAYQYRNASSGAAALPAEVLATIFTFAQVEWQPQRSTAKYDLGWVLITHVCSSWRRVHTAISAPSLWTKISCLCLAPRMLLEFVRRAQQSGLQYHVDTLLCDEKMPLDIWLHEPLLRRCRRVSLVAEDEDKFIDALNLIGHSLPLPALRDLEIKYDVSGDEWLSLKDATFDFTSFSALHKLSLRNCFPQWDTSPLPMKNLTHLSLMMSWYSGDLDDEMFRPTALVFRQMLDVLPLLTELTLTNLLPSSTDDLPDAIEMYPGFAQPFAFSMHLRRLTVEVYTIHAYSVDYRYFWNSFRVPSTTIVVVDLNIDSFDARMELEGVDGHDWLIPITCVDNAITPALEMTISRSTVSVRHAESSEDTWSRRSDIATCQYLASDHTRTTWLYRSENWDTDTVHGSRHIYVPSDLSTYINTLPLASTRALFLVSNLMLSMTSPSAWITSFAEAQDVQRLSFGYAASGHLLVALSRITVASDNARYLSLFPQLDTLILHADEDPSREDTRLRQPALELSLLDVLAVRKDAGAPVLQTYVDESMSEWDVWERLDDGVVVSFFL